MESIIYSEKEVKVYKFIKHSHFNGKHGQNLVGRFIQKLKFCRAAVVAAAGSDVHPSLRGEPQARWVECEDTSPAHSGFFHGVHSPLQGVISASSGQSGKGQSRGRR